MGFDGKLLKISKKMGLTDVTCYLPQTGVVL